jgi:hypothetical protein
MKDVIAALAPEQVALGVGLLLVVAVAWIWAPYFIRRPEPQHDERRSIRVGSFYLDSQARRAESTWLDGLEPEWDWPGRDRV